ncbi:MAG: hypothetical protein PUP93_14450 [Rhizonema sp. NSF051]|nr:hypothetical protein [Rhizonema sp. NSF051]
MHLIADICKETGLTLDDVQCLLMDVRADWATTETVTDSEYSLIQQSVQTVNSALPEGSAIAPVDPEQMALPLQQKLVQNASQILGFPLAIAVMQEIEMVDALTSAKNRAILAITEEKRRQLNNALHLQSEADQQAFVGAMHQLLGVCPKKINDDTAQKMQASAQKTNQTIAELMSLMGK